jgi:hypothetical protein
MRIRFPYLIWPRKWWKWVIDGEVVLGLGVDNEPDRRAPPVSARGRRREARTGWLGQGERLAEERERKVRGRIGPRGRIVGLRSGEEKKERKPG